jgi:hypothetical protein
MGQTGLGLRRNNPQNFCKICVKICLLMAGKVCCDKNLEKNIT